MSITAGMVAKDSAERFGRSFRLVLRRLKEEVPFERFILVDSSSTTSTSQVAKEEVSAEVLRLICNRAEARQILIDMARSDWILFIDDDVLLERGWFGPVKRLMSDPAVGLIWGPMSRRSGQQKDTYMESIEMFRREGSTTDTVVRMKALEGIKIPPFLHWREDTFIRNYVLSKGYRCAVSTVGMVHLKARQRILLDNSRVDVRLKWYCEKYVGTYRPSFRRSLLSLAAVLADPSSTGWRLKWFRYYSNLYRNPPPSVLQNTYKPRNQRRVK